MNYPVGLRSRTRTSPSRLVDVLEDGIEPYSFFFSGTLGSRASRVNANHPDPVRRVILLCAIRRLPPIDQHQHNLLCGWYDASRASILHSQGTHPGTFPTASNDRR